VTCGVSSKLAARSAPEKKAQPLGAALNPPKEEGGGDRLSMPDGILSRLDFRGSLAAPQNHIINPLIILLNAIDYADIYE
jgi:hypothetical protein